ncbi:hypothetical protein IGI39_004766 [Enterococcus sp. AZ135]
MSSKNKILLVLLGMLLFVNIYDYQYISKVERDHQTITISSETKKILVFYREDCIDCQKIMPTLIRYNLIDNKLLFINMNNPKNRKYIKDYHLTSVPAVVSNSTHYEGTDINKVFKIIRNGSKNDG